MTNEQIYHVDRWLRSFVMADRKGKLIRVPDEVFRYAVEVRRNGKRRTKWVNVNLKFIMLHLPRQLRRQYQDDGGLDWRVWRAWLEEEYG